MIQNALNSPPIVQMFFAALLLSSVANCTLILLGREHRPVGPDVEEMLAETPILLGFGGTLSSLYVALDSGLLEENFNALFAAALTTSLYGVVVSVSAQIGYAWRDREPPAQGR